MTKEQQQELQQDYERIKKAKAFLTDREWHQQVKDGTAIKEHYKRNFITHKNKNNDKQTDNGQQ